MRKGKNNRRNTEDKLYYSFCVLTVCKPNAVMHHGKHGRVNCGLESTKNVTRVLTVAIHAYPTRTAGRPTR